MTQTDDRWIARFIPEHYGLRVGARTFIVRFAPVMFFEHYDEAQLHALTSRAVWEVSFAEETMTADGRLMADYGRTGKGDAFRIVGSVAWGIIGWAQEKRPDYLFWWTSDHGRQSLYNRMILHFAARGSGWRRLTVDPFTGLRCQPEAFWLRRIPV